MTDYIKREDAAKELKKYFIEHDEEQDEFTLPAATLTANAIVDNMTKADVVEVVRCADCVYRPCEMMPYSYDFDYCSYGERADK